MRTPAQTATVDEESETQEEIVSVKNEQWDTALVHACSYHARKLDLKALDQYESGFVRNFDRALSQFSQIREQHPPQPVLENEPENEILENEPKPESKTAAPNQRSPFHPFLTSPSSPDRANPRRVA